MDCSGTGGIFISSKSIDRQYTQVDTYNEQDSQSLYSSSGQRRGGGYTAQSLHLLVWQNGKMTSSPSSPHGTNAILSSHKAWRTILLADTILHQHPVTNVPACPAGFPPRRNTWSETWLQGVFHVIPPLSNDQCTLTKKERQQQQQQ